MLLILLTTLSAKINEVKCKTPSITNLATNSALNAKINEVQDKTPNINNLPATAALTSVIKHQIKKNTKFW